MKQESEEEEEGYGEGAQSDYEELGEEEKAVLLEYLHSEYEKNPESFPFPKEQLAKIVEQEDMN